MGVKKATVEEIKKDAEARKKIRKCYFPPIPRRPHGIRQEKIILKTLEDVNLQILAARAVTQLGNKWMSKTHPQVSRT